MLWAAYIALIVIGLFCKNSRAYDLTVILFMGLLAWLNTNHADYATYLSIYLNPTMIPDVDLGWVFLCELGSLIGLSYNGFACVITVMAMLLYREFSKLIGGNTSLTLALFLVYPGIISLVQFRQFVASAIGCLAVAVLCSKSKRRTLWYLLLVACAVFVQRTAVVFLIAIFAKVFFVCGKRGRFIIGLVAVLGVAFALANAEDLALSMFGEMRTSAYLSAGDGSLSVGTLGAIRNTLLLVMMAITPYFCCKTMARQVTPVYSEVWGSGIALSLKYIVLINVSLLIITPFVFITNDFMRFERHGFSLAIALFSMMPSLKDRHPVLSCKAFYLFIGIIFAYFYAGVVFDSVYAPMLTFSSVPPFFS